MNPRSERTTDGRNTRFINREIYLSRFAKKNAATHNQLKLTTDNQAFVAYQASDQLLASIEEEIRKLEVLHRQIEELAPKLLDQSKANKAATEMINQHLAQVKTPVIQLKEFRETFNLIKEKATVAFDTSLSNINQAPDLSNSTHVELQRQKALLEQIKTLGINLEPIQSEMNAVRIGLLQFDKSTPSGPREKASAKAEAFTPK